METTRPLEVRPNREPDGTLRVALIGELDVATADEVAAVLREAAASKQAVVLDLADLEFMDSTGLRLLLSSTADASRDGWSFGVTRPSRAVRRLFEVTRTTVAMPFVG